MGIRRACSYKATFTLPKTASNYSAILVTIQQKGRNLISKTKTQLTTDTTARVVMNLTQAETRQFEAGVPAYVQIRCYASATDAPGSNCWPVEVWPALDDQILP